MAALAHHARTVRNATRARVVGDGAAGLYTLLARLCPLGMAAHDIVAGRLPRRARRDGSPAALEKVVLGQPAC